MSRDTPEAPKGTQAVIRAIHLLKAVARVELGLSLSDLSVAVGLSRPTAHRILTALISEGLVIQNQQNHNFLVGPEAIRIASRVLQRGDLRSVARPYLESLADECGETVTLEIPIHDEMLILDEVGGRHLIGARAEIGTRWPMYATSSGKSFLASLTDNDLNVRLLAKRTRFTPLTLVDEDDLRASIRRSRSRGYATAVAELQVDYCATSAAVQNSNSDVVAAVSIGGPRKRLTSKRLAELGTLVRAAAEGVSRVLRS